ncbi:MAG: hypothetical protein IJB82_03390 [Bacilli bacterium]|nr:hypothetical protein [Bacilli bacterium]
MIKRNKLKNISITLLFLSLLDSIKLLYNYLIGGYNTNNYPEYPVNIIKLSIIIVLITSFLNILIKVFLSIRGFKEVNDIPKDNIHKIVAKLYEFILIIILIINLFDFIVELNYLLSLIYQIINIIVVYKYIRAQNS